MDLDDPLIKPGDQLQSSASRLAEFVSSCIRGEWVHVPYEVRMAVYEAESAIEQWTRVRAS